MAENILSDVQQQNSDVYVRVTSGLAVAPATPRVLVEPEPMRLALLVVPTFADTILAIAPNAQTYFGAASKVGRPNVYLVHAAEWPGVCEMRLWVTADQADTLTVYEMLDRSLRRADECASKT